MRSISHEHKAQGFRLFRPLREVIALHPVLMYYAIVIDFSLFLSGSFGGLSGISLNFLGCPRCGSILSIYSRGTAS
jgi:hypothetical protein